MVEIDLVNANTTIKDYIHVQAGLTCRMLQDARHFVELTKKNMQSKKKALNN